MIKIDSNEPKLPWLIFDQGVIEGNREGFMFLREKMDLVLSGPHHRIEFYSPEVQVMELLLSHPPAPSKPDPPSIANGIIAFVLVSIMAFAIYGVYAFIEKIS